MWDACAGVGLRSVFATCVRAAPLLIKSAEQMRSEQRAAQPLVVLVSSFGGKAFTFNVAYGVGKAAVDRLASDMDRQMRPLGVGVVSLYPGVVKTEGNLEMEKRGTWDEASGGIDLASGESPEFSGKAVAALAKLNGDELLEKYSGEVVVVAELAKKLGFTEADGSQPPSIRSLQYLAPNFIFPQIEKESGKPLPAWVRDNVPDLLLPWSVFAGGPPPEESD